MKPILDWLRWGLTEIRISRGSGKYRLFGANDPSYTHILKTANHDGPERVTFRTIIIQFLRIN